MTWCGAGYQAGHAYRETDRHNGHCRRAAEASQAFEEGIAPPGSPRRHRRDSQCVIISPWGSL